MSEKKLNKKAYEQMKACFDAQYIDNQRAQFAAMAMQGMLANGAYSSPSVMAYDAVLYADALIEELKK